MFSSTFRMLLPLAMLAAPLTAAEWMTDYNAAKAKAAQENKAVLLDFTGSDWCGWCIRIRRDVLDKPEFETYVKDKFVLVEVDMPRDPAKLTPEQSQANEALCKQFCISGFPTFVVTTPEGDVTGGFVGGRDCQAAVETPLNAALKVAADLKNAEKLEGNAKVEALIAAYNAIPQELQSAATKLRDQILELDTEDKSGLRHVVQLNAERDAIRADLRSATSMADGIVRADEWLKKAMPENKMELYNFKADRMARLAESIEDMEAAEKVAYQAYDLLPEQDKPRAKEVLDRIFKDKASMLEKIKAAREAEAQVKPAH